MALAVFAKVNAKTLTIIGCPNYDKTVGACQCGRTIAPDGTIIVPTHSIYNYGLGDIPGSVTPAQFVIQCRNEAYSLFQHAQAQAANPLAPIPPATAPDLTS